MFHFKSSKKICECYAPLKGKINDITTCSDAAFASKALGEGVVLIPECSELRAPFDGVITTIFPTKHAIGLTSKGGLELLIHLGIDSFKLNGEGIEYRVVEGDHFQTEDVLGEIDFDVFHQNNISIETPIVITNMTNIKKYEPSDLNDVSYEDIIFTYEYER